MLSLHSRCTTALSRFRGWAREPEARVARAPCKNRPRADTSQVSGLPARLEERQEPGRSVVHDRGRDAPRRGLPLLRPACAASGCRRPDRRGVRHRVAPTIRHPRRGDAAVAVPHRGLRPREPSASRPRHPASSRRRARRRGSRAADRRARRAVARPRRAHRPRPGDPAAARVGRTRRATSSPTCSASRAPGRRRRCRGPARGCARYGPRKMRAPPDTYPVDGCREPGRTDTQNSGGRMPRRRPT